MRISESLLHGERRLRRRSTSARLDAELLMAHILGTDRTGVYTRVQDFLPNQDHHTYQRLIEMRRHGIPIAYLTRRQASGDLNLHVDPRVLIPRPSTELLIQAVIQHANQPGLLIADIGTGSGVIAIQLARALPEAQIAASDISMAALEVARLNAERYQVEDRITWHVGSLLEPWMNRLEPHVIVANLPYLPPEQLKEFSIQHEPTTALYGGRTGLTYIQQLIRQVARLPLVEQVALECLPAQVDTVAYWLRQITPHRFRVEPILDGQIAWGVRAWRS